MDSWLLFGKSEGLQCKSEHSTVTPFLMTSKLLLQNLLFMKIDISIENRLNLFQHPTSVLCSGTVVEGGEREPAFRHRLDRHRCQSWLGSKIPNLRGRNQPSNRLRNTKARLLRRYVLTCFVSSSNVSCWWGTAFICIRSFFTAFRWSPKFFSAVTLSFSCGKTTTHKCAGEAWTCFDMMLYEMKWNEMKWNDLRCMIW